MAGKPRIISALFGDSGEGDTTEFFFQWLSLSSASDGVEELALILGLIFVEKLIHSCLYCPISNLLVL